MANKSSQTATMKSLMCKLFAKRLLNFVAEKSADNGAYSTEQCSREQ